MPDWLITYLGSLQGGIVRTLAAEMRAGGLGTAWLAFGLGALHALTPGHGKAALAAYFLGREARIGKGVRIALMAALLHVLSGFAAFLVLRFFVGQAHSLKGRGSPAFTVLGYGLSPRAPAAATRTWRAHSARCCRYRDHRDRRADAGADWSLTQVAWLSGALGVAFDWQTGGARPSTFRSPCATSSRSSPSSRQET